jgi:multidrug efflux pump subunit AcrA (membrane-fusion protein)
VITESKADVLVIPVRAVSQQGADSVVKVKKDSGNVETVKVKLGTRNAQVVEVVEGLKEGQQVVLPPVAAASTGNAGGAPGKNEVFVGPGPGGGGGGPGPIIQFNPGP